MNLNIDTLASALATVTSVIYRISTRNHPHHGPVVTLDSAGSSVPEDGSDDASVRAVMAERGLEFVDSGANGGPEGGFYSYWRKALDITVCTSRDSIDPEGLATDEEYRTLAAAIVDAVREAYPHATVREVNSPIRTGCSDESETYAVREIAARALEHAMDDLG